MTHGWPGSVIELLGTVGPLTDPTAHGGTPEDEFHLVLLARQGQGAGARRALARAETLGLAAEAEKAPRL
jgi:hypothetical protein